MGIDEPIQAGAGEGGKEIEKERRKRGVCVGEKEGERQVRERSGALAHSKMLSANVNVERVLELENHHFFNLHFKNWLRQESSMNVKCRS